jgi:hypothetical protein
LIASRDTCGPHPLDHMGEQGAAAKLDEGLAPADAAPRASGEDHGRQVCASPSITRRAPFRGLPIVGSPMLIPTMTRS